MSKKQVATEKSAVVEKRFNVKSSQKLTALFIDSLQSIAAKIRANKTLTLIETCIAIAVALRYDIADYVSNSSFVSTINNKTKYETSTSSALVKDNQIDMRSAIYQLTVSLYDAKSQFAKAMTIFDIETTISSKVHARSNKFLHVLKRLRLTESFIACCNEATAKQNIATIDKFVLK